jgi:hypothetical protein
MVQLSRSMEGGRLGEKFGVLDGKRRKLSFRLAITCRCMANASVLTRPTSDLITHVFRFKRRFFGFDGSGERESSSFSMSPSCCDGFRNAQYRDASARASAPHG